MKHSCQRRAVLCLVASAAVWLGLHGVAFGDVAYSKIDRATVKVIALGNVKTIRVHTKSGKTPRLAMPEVGHGSGIQVASEGLILTAHHVVDGARFVAVRLPGSRKAYPAHVVYKNKRRDFAFVAIPENVTHVLPLPEQIPRLQVRQTVFAIGYPLDAERERPQSTRGIVSGVLSDGRLQLGIAVNPGNSGGPVIDDQNRLVGLLIARGDPGQGVQGIGVAVPLDTVTAAYHRITKQGGAFSNASQRVRTASKGEWAKARLTAALAEGKSTLGMVREATAAADGRKPDRIVPSLSRALKAAKSDPDVLVVAGAYYWNAAQVLKELNREEWRATFARAKSKCRRAKKLDASIVSRSPFVAMVVGARNSAD